MVVGENPVIAVTDEVWRRALIRARARGYDVEFVKEPAAGRSVWRVSSCSEPGSWRYVGIATVRSGIAASCDCPAGQHDRPCVHVALVLRELAVIDDPDPGVVVALAA